MFDRDALMDELQTLKIDVSRVLHATADGIVDSLTSRTETLAERILPNRSRPR